MGETAEERARRLRRHRYLQSMVFPEDYEQMLDDICREMFYEVFDEPTVSLVKKYKKGSFKFV